MAGMRVVDWGGRFPNKKILLRRTRSSQLWGRVGRLRRPAWRRAGRGRDRSTRHRYRKCRGPLTSEGLLAGAASRDSVQTWKEKVEAGSSQRHLKWRWRTPEGRFMPLGELWPLFRIWEFGKEVNNNATPSSISVGSSL